MLKGPPALPPRFASLQAMLANAAGSAFGITFVDAREEERRLSYAQLHQRAAVLAGDLHERGSVRGDRIALVLPTGPDFLVGFFGAVLAGAVPVPLYPPLRLGRLPEYHAATARMLRAAGCRLVLTDPTLRRLLGQSVSQANPALGCRTVAELGERPAGGRLGDTAAPGDLALIQFSSGSTVDPKPVALSHENLLSHLACLESVLPGESRAQQSGVSWLPLYHDMGLIGCLLMALHVPGPLTLLPPEAFLARPALWLRALSRHRGTCSAAPNFAYGLCLKRIRDEELEGVDLSAWRLALNGAEHVSPDLMRRFVERFEKFGLDPLAVRPVYGMSETTLAVTCALARPSARTVRVDPAAMAARGEVSAGARELASVGIPLPGVEVQVRDSAGQELPDGRVGEVAVRGPSVMSGYFGQPEATRAAIRGGWLSTGDLGFIAGGELFITGRSKEVIVIRGANHNPQEFEEPASRVPGVRAGGVAALGFLPEGNQTEELLILVERFPAGPEPGVQAIRDAVLEGTGILPHTVRVLAPGTLPRTSSGKLRRTEALRRFLVGDLKAAPVKTLIFGAELLKSALAFARTRPP